MCTQLATSHGSGQETESLHGCKVGETTMSSQCLIGVRMCQNSKWSKFTPRGHHLLNTSPICYTTIYSIKLPATTVGWITKTHHSHFIYVQGYCMVRLTGLQRKGCSLTLYFATGQVTTSRTVCKCITKFLRVLFVFGHYQLTSWNSEWACSLILKLWPDDYHFLAARH